MAQAGGPTTESGILFQNFVASLYLGDLAGEEDRSNSERVVSVRVESPTHVDDTVVTYADGHLVYIQAKERLTIQLSKLETPSQDENVEEESEEVESLAKKKPPAWVKLWRDFEAQFFNSKFELESEERNSDRLLLYVGSQTNPLYLLNELCFSADGANNSTEWFDGLPKAQQTLVRKKIQPLLHPEHQNPDSMFALLKHVDVEFSSLDYLEKHLAPRRMPACSVAPATLFDLLVTEAGRNARKRKQFDAATLRADLKKRHGIEFKVSASIQKIKTAVAKCNLALKSSRNTIGQKGEHQPRAITQTIVDWLCRDWTTEGPLPKEEESLSVDNVALLHTIAGMGKTVVLHDALAALEARGVPTLAIKTDSQLRQLSRGYSIEKCLNLPDSIERVVERLSRLQTRQGVVVIIDQLDALSLSLASHQFALEEVVKLVTQLRAMPRVRVLLSCRTFDLNTDPALKSLPRKIEFPLEPFSPEETEIALNRLGIDSSILSRGTKELLRVPLHLDLLALAIENRPDQLQSTENAPVLGGVATLQDLHELLWDAVVENPYLTPEQIAQRSEAISLLVDRMQETQKTSVPKSFWTQTAHVSLSKTAQALAGAGILVEDKTGWRFWHQTFNDYCAARRFLEGDESLAQSILSSDQGLPQRPRMIQILAYLRAKDERRYLEALSQLLESPDLEDHLRDLLIRWFAGLQNPSEHEWEVAQTQLEAPETRRQFLERASVGNGWFSWLRSDILTDLFQTQNSDEEADGLNYLRAMLNFETGQEQATRFLEPYLDASERWNERLAHLLSLIHHWHSEAAVALFEEVCSRWLEGKLLGQYSLLEALPRIAKSPCANAPVVICRILRFWFSVELDRYGAQHGQTYVSPPEPTHAELEAMDAEEFDRHLQQTLDHLSPSTPDPLHAFDEQNAHYIIDEVFDGVAERAPEEFLELVVFVAERVVNWTHSKPRFGFKHDPLFATFRHDVGGHIHRSVECLLHDGLLIAGKALAGQPEKLRPSIERLQRLRFASPQTYVAALYRHNPEQFAEEAVDFLCEDVRRLYLGFASQANSAALIAAIFPFLNKANRRRLEATIKQFEITKYWRDSDTSDKDLRHFRGMSQLRLLLPISRELLSPPAQRFLQQLERKFPEMQGYQPLETENIAGSTRIGNADLTSLAPASTRSKKISDDNWVRVINRHTVRRQRIESRLLRKTPVIEVQLSELAIDDADDEDLDLGLPNDAWQLAKGKLKQEIVAEPDRFARLATERLPNETDSQFACAFIEGLKESNASSASAFEVVRHFKLAVAPFVVSAAFWQSVADLVEARKDEGVPDDILELLERHLQAMEFSTPASFSSRSNQRRTRSNRRTPTNNAESETPTEEDEIDENSWLNMGPLIDYLNDWPHHHIFEALMKGLAANEAKAKVKDEEAARNYRQRRWDWIAWTAEHPADAVRCGGLIYLLDLFDTERQRTFVLYEKLVENRLELLSMFYSMEVLRHGIVWFYPRVNPHIEKLLNAEQAAIAQRGAFLATIAAWHGHDSRIEFLLQGRPAWRRGVAKVWSSRVFATNSTPQQLTWCHDGLKSLVNDEDEWVQRRLNRVVRNLKASSWNAWQPFLQAIIAAPALSEAFDGLANYIWEHGKSHKAATLDLVEQLLQTPVKRRSTFEGHGGDPLVRAVLNVYNSPLTPSEVKKRCVKLFGRLLREFSGDGNRALSEWDQGQFTLG